MQMENAMAPHSSTLSWKIPWTEEPGRLQSMELQRVGHDGVANTFTFKLASADLGSICCLGGFCSVAKLCLTLCDPMNCSMPVSSVHGISQARILEWVATSHSRVSSRPKD